MNFIDNFLNRRTDKPYSVEKLEPKELYEKLEDYYNNSDEIYGNAQAGAYYNSLWIENIKPIRTVVNRSVEFYVSKILPGDISKIGIATDNQAVKDAIEQVWKWSNFGSQKQVAVRHLSLFGDLFVKIASNESKLFYEIIEPENVTSFSTDNRGYITEIRIDIPIVEEKKHLTYTEYWNKADGYFSTWTHSLDSKTPLEQLGEPDNFSYLSEFGIDFVPIVHIKFKDIGKKLGASCVQHALSKIDEANREATRLAELLFRYNKPIWAVSANAIDAQGRPLPAPKVKNSTSSDIDVKDNSIVYLPGTSTLNSLIPDIKYADALAILKDMMNELEQDLPELRYYAIQDSNLSGKAIKFLLAGAIDRAEEARGNFLAGLTRLNEMALTIGSYLGFFNGIGTYENGDYEHSIEAPDMFSLSVEEKASLLKDLATAGVPLGQSLRMAGYSEDFILQTLEEKSKDINPLDAQLMQRL